MNVVELIKGDPRFKRISGGSDCGIFFGDGNAKTPDISEDKVFKLDENTEFKRIDFKYLGNIKIKYSIFYSSIQGEMDIFIEKGDPLEKEEFKGNKKLLINGFASKDEFTDEENKRSNIFVGVFRIYEYKAITEHQATGGTQKWYRMKFVDEFSFETRRLYKGQGWTNKSIKDICESETFLGGYFENFKYKTTNFDKAPTDTLSLTCGQNKHFFSVLNSIKRTFGCVFYQTRKQFVIKSWKDIINGEKLEINGNPVKFKYPVNDTVSSDWSYNIFYKKLDQGNSLEISGINNISNNSYDPNKASNKPEIKNAAAGIANSTNNTMENSNPKQSTATSAQRFCFPEKTLESETIMKLLFSTRLDIIVEGSHFIEVGDIVEVQIAGNEGNSTTVSGNFVIVEITDLYHQEGDRGGGGYASLLTLGKADTPY